MGRPSESIPSTCTSSEHWAHGSLRCPLRGSSLLIVVPRDGLAKGTNVSHLTKRSAIQLFKSQCFNGIKLRRFARRVVSEENSYYRREHDRCHNGHGRDRDRPMQDMADAER